MSLPAAARPHMFRKGKSGNPSGKPPLPPELRAISSLSQHIVTKLISKYAAMSALDLEAFLDDRRNSALELSIASMFLKSIENGDYARLSFLLDRAIGKIPVAEPTTEEEIARMELRELTDKELVEFIQEKIPLLEGKT